jgi:ATP synthase protein I
VTTTPSGSPAPAPSAPFSAMLRGALLPSVAAGLVAVVVLWTLRQSSGGLAALLGVAVAVVFFAAGLYVMKRVVGANPLSVLAGALAVYLGQIIFLGVIILVLSGARWLDGTAFGLAILVVALIWQACQVVVFLRMRQGVYDEPSSASAPEPGPSGQSGPGAPAPGRPGPGESAPGAPGSGRAPGEGR